MGLRDRAAADLLAIQTDADTGFGWPFVLIDPAGVETPLVGLTTDIGLAIDPDTGMTVSGRQASVSVPLASLAGLSELPRGVADAAVKPWRVRFDDIGGTSHTFKITETQPDRAIGNLVCLLEVYQ